jgi:3-phosphoshikimate 1-carboxyvinyltransferase
VGRVRFDPAGPLRGSLHPPADKSITHRAAIVAAMGEGETVVHNYLDAADTRSTLGAMKGLGAGVELSRQGSPKKTALTGPQLRPRREGRALRIRGVGLRGPVSADIDVGNAGTLLRILPGWLAGQATGEWTLDGDESIRRRPVDRIVEPLSRMGAKVSAEANDRRPPLALTGAPLHGIDYRLPVASAQVKSCVMLAGLLAEGETTLTEPRPTRDHTERMLRSAGAVVSVEDAGTPVAIRGELPARRVRLAPADRIEAGELIVPGDFSSAAFLLVAALLVPDSRVRVEGVGINPTRIGLLGVLTRMGAAIEVVETAAAGLEPVGTITATHGPLEGTRVGGGEVPLTIDELPLVALAGCFAEGQTIVSGAQELRHKESDRVATVVEGLSGLGAEIEATDDGFAVTGSGGLRGGVFDSAADHRLAMLGAIAGLASSDGVEVRGFEAAEVSYPGLAGDLEALLRPA